ncbi:minor capsid protein [uncultured Mitsuokella sp.]|uniref:minor capsid protein n=1 Tax=uncultured Mitsuokella sp. TaxID=453120 RepID=UPI00262D3676|nr:minor capsid protein [uncultured Mitsuokella sp.]
MTKKATPTETYWQKRQRELEEEWNRKSRQEIERELKAYYEQSLAHIEKDIQTLYQRFATDNGLDMAAAQQLLMGSEYRVWRMDLQEYAAKINATGDKALLRELNTLAMRSRITRLDALRSETIKEMIQLSEKTERAMSRFLPSAYKDFYYHGIYEIGKTRGLDSAVGAVDGKRMESILRTPWSGKNYSARIWSNNAKLGDTIQRNIIAAAHRGVPMKDMVRDVRTRMNVGASDATRLVRTELNYVQNQAALDSIKDAGMEYYRFMATLDRRTSSICRSKDGMVFPVEDASPGENMPPLHPRCRSIISGSLYAEHKPRKGTRIARDEHGKNVFVPAGMRYEDWKKKYVDGSKLLIQDVTNDYIERSKSGKGVIAYESGYMRSEHKAEVDAAKWLCKTFGGSVTLLQEINADKKKTPDLLWDGAFWDLKTISTEKAADSAIRHGLKQIEENPGGFILDFVGESLNLEELTAVIYRRLHRSAKSSTDVIVSSKEELIAVLRYDIKNKRKPPRQ